MMSGDLDMMRHLRARALKAGVEMVDKTQVVELLKQEGRVTGAVGFNLLDGRLSLFNAKATILANGNCDFGVMRMWASANGDGVAAAYHAGAQMRNAEFANFYDVINKATGIPMVYGFEFLYNNIGEHISPKYITGREPDIPISIILGMEKEVTGRKRTDIHPPGRDDDVSSGAISRDGKAGLTQRRFLTANGAKARSVSGLLRTGRSKSPSVLRASFLQSRWTRK